MHFRLQSSGFVSKVILQGTANCWIERGETEGAGDGGGKGEREGEGEGGVDNVEGTVEGEGWRDEWIPEVGIWMLETGELIIVVVLEGKENGDKLLRVDAGTEGKFKSLLYSPIRVSTCSSIEGISI